VIQGVEMVAVGEKEERWERRMPFQMDAMR
jgi:hypothetical protein